MPAAPLRRRCLRVRAWFRPTFGPGLARPSPRIFAACAAAALAALSTAAAGGSPASAEEIRRERFVASPKPGVAVLASAYYTRPTGLDLISMHQWMSRSDTTDVAFIRISPDHGATWSAPEEVRTEERRPDGTLRRMLRGGCVDAYTGVFLRFRIEGVLPTDDPLEGLRRWTVHYSGSRDGGRTWFVDEQIIHRGPGYTAVRPLPGVEIGKTCYMIGDTASVPLFLADGTLLLPIILTPAGPDGNYVNPGGGYTYTDAAVLLGRWTADRSRLEWEISERVRGDPARSTRGMDEPTLAALADGRLLMVLRGSNDRKPDLPGHRWAAYSSDHGRSWTTPAPWTYTDGTTFHSPSSCSQLLTHSSGRIFWLGNLTPENPRGNRPRYPFVVGEVDRGSGRLMERTVRVVDDRRPDDSPDLALSNFSAREDRATGEIVLHLTRLFARSHGETRDWTADAEIYRIAVRSE